MSYSQILGSQSASQQLCSQNFNQGPSHLTPPSYVFPDRLPPLSPLPYRETTSASHSDSVSTDVPMEESAVSSHALSVPSPVHGDHSFQAGDSLPPRKGHRRCSSDTPLGFSAMIQTSPQLMPIGTWVSLEKSVSGGGNSGPEKPIQLVRKGSSNGGNHNNNPEGVEEKKGEIEVVNDMFSEYMNLENIAELNSLGMEVKGFEIKASGSKTNGDESKKLPPLGNRTVQHSRSNSVDVYNSNVVMELRNGEFSEEELNKITKSDKLAEIALSDPKRAKRILSNRQSAARSKERKMQYITELEQKVQTLQTETATLSTQLKDSEMDNVGLKSENKELKFRLQAMDEQSHLKDALNETLTGEVRHLRHTLEKLGGESLLSSYMARQLAINEQILKLQQKQQQPRQLKISELQHHLPQQEAQFQSQQLQQPESQSY
ncbi:Transcription factor RF2a [Quillaja saponaria]|uniref:Transcription factor RF2a n=1 Tax=Quillaja saponaria TaxID=32244 RepID=A0AAD7LGX8_QUISA|nr:Transcription factor RF2a [Quillaja saponaria]